MMMQDFDDNEKKKKKKKIQTPISATQTKTSLSGKKEKLAVYLNSKQMSSETLITQS